MSTVTGVLTAIFFVLPLQLVVDQSNSLDAKSPFDAWILIGPFLNALIFALNFATSFEVVYFTVALGYNLVVPILFIIVKYFDLYSSS